MTTNDPRMDALYAVLEARKKLKSCHASQSDAATDSNHASSQLAEKEAEFYAICKEFEGR